MLGKTACITLIVSLIVLTEAFSEPSNLEKQYDTGCFLSAPRNGELVVIGVASRHVKPDEGLEAALSDAARKVALYMGVSGKVIREQTTSGNFFDFSAVVSTEISYNTDFDKYRQALIYNEEKDILRTADTVFVRCSYPVSSIKNVNYTAADSKPSWINSQPAEIAGYSVGVGFAGRHRRLSETIKKSYENAIIALLFNVSSIMIVLDIDIAGHRAGSKLLEAAEGELNGFFVLETWIDPKTKSVWTLAIAKEQ
jgi:hypothetical protein